MEKAYAKALDSLIRVERVSEADAYTKLVAHLKTAGRMKILPQLLRELRTLRQRQEAKGPLLEVASEKESKQAEAAVKKDGVAVRAKVNPTLIRGWRLTTSDTLTDQSGKRSLIDLYRSIVTH